MAKKEQNKTPTKKAAASITASSTAEYFSKNLQQVGFSSPTKAVLTTLKEALDNSLDACEEHGILPEIKVLIEKKGAGSLKNTDQIRICVQDNGPGIDVADLPKVFGEYLASSKFGRGRCTRGQQGIGISAATTWALQTSATGAKVITKTKGQRKATSCMIEIDLKNNKGILKNKDTIDWAPDHGTRVEFLIDGRIQTNGEAGLLSYLRGTVLVNPHLTLDYKLPDGEEAKIDRVSDIIPDIPAATEPHPHTMKLGEFMAHSKFYGKVKVRNWLVNGFSRLTDGVLAEVAKSQKLSPKLYDKALDSLGDEEFKALYSALQNGELRAPSTQSVLSVGEDALAKSIKRLGEVDFFSVMSRKPAICDFKPVQVEVAIARFLDSGMDPDDPVQVLRFANRVPLQFDKAACAIVKSINTVNWRSYGLRQPKDSLPLGSYILAVSVVSPFIKFKNASKETIDASDELVEEIRRALMQAGQRLSRHIRKESREADLEERIQHIEQFGPMLVDGLVRITGSNDERKKRAEDGLRKILGRDAKDAIEQLESANVDLEKQVQKEKKKRGSNSSDAQEESEDGEKDTERE